MIDISKKIEQLERDCGKEWELAFDNFLLIDVQDVGEVQELFTDTDLYLFWLTMAYEVNTLLSETLGTDRKDQLMKLIRLKRTVDTNLLKLKDETEISKDLGFELHTVSTDFLELNFSEEKTDAFLNELYDMLDKDGFIKTNRAIFLSHFRKVDKTIKINWIGKQIELLGFIKFLENNQIIKTRRRTKTKIILEHFEIKNQPILSGSVGATLTDAREWGDKGYSQDDQKVHEKYLVLKNYVGR